MLTDNIEINICCILQPATGLEFKCFGNTIQSVFLSLTGTRANRRKQIQIYENEQRLSITIRSDRFSKGFSDTITAHCRYIWHTLPVKKVCASVCVCLSLCVCVCVFLCFRKLIYYCSHSAPLHALLSIWTVVLTVCSNLLLFNCLTTARPTATPARKMLGIS